LRSFPTIWWHSVLAHVSSCYLLLNVRSGPETVSP
jgi:hypothetical protein